MKHHSINYPRVLVISAAALNSSSATGMTMVNLFNGWPLDRIAQICHEESEPDPDVCINFRRFSNMDVPFVSTIKGLLAQFRTRRNVSSLNPEVIAVPDSSLTHGVGAVWADVLPFRLSENFWAWIREFNPQIIYSVLGSARIMSICLKISTELSIPIVPHFMDDWPETIYRESIWHKIPRLKLLGALSKILEIAPIGLTISDAMAHVYAKRYSMRVSTFMNCVDLPDIHVVPSLQKDESVNFGYIGGLHLNRWKSLLQIADALMKNGESSRTAKLTVFIPERDIVRYGRLLAKHPMVHIGGTLQPSEIPVALNNFDVLLHIESFDMIDRLYTRLSISTKIPLYMASGKPILAYGPDEVASCRYIDEVGCGIVIGSQDQNLLANAVFSLVSNPCKRAKYGKIGRNAALNRHQASTERDRFRRILAEYCAL